jgi:hypothetical protein
MEPDENHQMLEAMMEAMEQADMDGDADLTTLAEVALSAMVRYQWKTDRFDEETCQLVIDWLVSEAEDATDKVRRIHLSDPVDGHLAIEGNVRDIAESLLEAMHHMGHGENCLTSSEAKAVRIELDKKEKEIQRLETEIENLKKART